MCVSCSTGPPLRVSRIRQSCYRSWWIMDFGIRPRDKTPKSGVAHCNLSPSQESENERIQIQIDSHLLFWQSGVRPQRICATRTKCQSKFLSENPWKTQENSGTCATRHCTHVDAAPRQRPMSHGSLHQRIFGRQKYSCDSSASLFAGSQSLWLLFIPRLKSHLKGRHFGTLDNTQKSVTDELKGIPAEAFQHCYEQWKQCLRRCVAAQGNCFEGDNLDL